MLKLESIQTLYGPSRILFDVSLRIDAGEMVILMGRNGMGKTTTVRSIMGLARSRAGTIRFRDTEGLVSLVCAEIWRCLERLKTVGQTILLIDSTHGALMQIADRHYIMEKRPHHLDRRLRRLGRGGGRQAPVSGGLARRTHNNAWPLWPFPGAPIIGADFKLGRVRASYAFMIRGGHTLPWGLHPSRGLRKGNAAGDADQAPPLAYPSAGSTGTARRVKLNWTFMRG